MCRWWRYIRSIRSAAGATSITDVEMEPAIDLGPVAGEETPPLLGLVTPPGERTRRQELLEGGALAGGAKDNARAGPRRPQDLPPQRRERPAIHPVDAVEKDVAIAARHRL